MAIEAAIEKLKEDFKKMRISQDAVAKKTGINKVMQGKIYSGKVLDRALIKKLRAFRDEQKSRLAEELASI